MESHKERLKACKQQIEQATAAVQQGAAASQPALAHLLLALEAVPWVLELLAIHLQVYY